MGLEVAVGLGHLGDDGELIVRVSSTGRQPRGLGVALGGLVVLQGISVQIAQEEEEFVEDGHNGGRDGIAVIVVVIVVVIAILIVVAASLSLPSLSLLLFFLLLSGNGINIVTVRIKESARGFAIGEDYGRAAGARSTSISIPTTIVTTCIPIDRGEQLGLVLLHEVVVQVHGLLQKLFEGPLDVLDGLPMAAGGVLVGPLYGFLHSGALLGRSLPQLADAIVEARLPKLGRDVPPQGEGRVGQKDIGIGLAQLGPQPRGLGLDVAAATATAAVLALTQSCELLLDFRALRQLRPQLRQVERRHLLLTLFVLIEQLCK